jgi:hypothetical protein
MVEAAGRLAASQIQATKILKQWNLRCDFHHARSCSKSHHLIVQVVLGGNDYHLKATIGTFLTLLQGSTDWHPLARQQSATLFRQGNRRNRKLLRPTTRPIIRPFTTRDAHNQSPGTHKMRFPSYLDCPSRLRFARATLLTEVPSKQRACDCDLKRRV